ncbi:short-chain dehydrogenase [Novimethylophilus kurashikiensis]|uniref:Short-chain dehydrogenase n=1 Tax=Novimethylophilus kurashikiensis TaxID=1825523 RepID=A0A2R5F8T5_9PROT|nr:SDR family oxidoreductase [Novimethylophilus kurashikiensis]GBG14662.1 short-chain dehydrogenase [Novimethylophilus kurashikiensis]
MPTLLITGANRGLGLEFVKQYAADGWNVLACCRAPVDAVELNAIATSSAGLVSLHALDVSDLTAIDRLAGEISQPLDLIISNAGIYPDRSGGFGHTDYAAWDLAFRVNTMATLKLAEAFIGHLERGEGKVFAAVSSKMGSLEDNTSGGHYLYRSSKSAVNMVVKSLAIDLAPRGIKAIVLHPGWVLTDMGGPNAMIDTTTSISGMRKVLSRVTPNDSGRFISYDGTEIGW